MSSIPTREAFRIETLNRLIETSDRPVRLLIEEVKLAEEFIYGPAKPSWASEPQVLGSVSSGPQRYGYSTKQCMSMHCPNYRDPLNPAS